MDRGWDGGQEGDGGDDVSFWDGGEGVHWEAYQFVGALQDCAEFSEEV